MFNFDSFTDKTKKGKLLKSSLPCELCGCQHSVAVYQQPDGTLMRYCFGRCEGSDRARIIDSLEELGQLTETNGKYQVQSTETPTLSSLCEARGYPEEVALRFKGSVSEKGRVFYSLGGTKTKPFVKGEGHPTIKGEYSAYFYGQHLHRGQTKLVVTEGEEDAEALSFVLEHHPEYLVVSVPNGANSAKKIFSQQYKFLDSFREIYLCFDQDTPGQGAVDEVAPFIPGVKVVKLPHKDVCDCTKLGLHKQVREAVLSADQYKPSFLLNTDELFSLVDGYLKQGAYDTGFAGLNHLFGGGLYPGTIVTLTGETGASKSTLCRALAWNLSHQARVGYITLEDSLQLLWKSWYREYGGEQNLLSFLQDTHQRIETPKVSVLSSKYLLQVIQYLALAGCKVIVLDHLTLLLEAQGGEKHTLAEEILSNLRNLCNQHNLVLILVSHLSRGEGWGLHRLKHSSAIAQVSDSVLQISRVRGSNLSSLEVLKTYRGYGTTGSVTLSYHTHYEEMTYETTNTPDQTSCGSSSPSVIGQTIDGSTTETVCTVSEGQSTGDCGTDTDRPTTDPGPNASADGSPDGSPRGTAQGAEGVAGVEQTTPPADTHSHTESNGASSAQQAQAESPVRNSIPAGQRTGGDKLDTGLGVDSGPINDPLNDPWYAPVAPDPEFQISWESKEEFFNGVRQLAADFDHRGSGRRSRPISLTSTRNRVKGTFADRLTQSLTEGFGPAGGG